MSRIDDLIKQLCPNGVRTALLGDLGVIFGGLTGKSKADFSRGNARFVSYVNVFNNIAVDLGADDFVCVKPGEHQRTLTRGDIVFTGSSETPDEVGMSSVVTTQVDKPLYLNSFCIGFRFNDPGLLDPDFAKYLFRSVGMRRQIVRTASGVTRFNVSKARLAKIVVPLPPVEVQREIAHTLDLFTSLEADLEADLEARGRQYAFYRDQLLSFPKREVRWVPMGELGTFTRGRRFINADFTDEGIPCIHYGEIYTHYGTSARTAKSHVREELAPSLRFARPGDLVIVVGGESIADVCKAVAWLGDTEVAVHDECYIFHHSLNPKYASFFLSSDAFNKQKVRFARGAKIVRVSVEDLRKIRVPVPSEHEQERIVEILDNFDDLVNDLSIGLPAELNARRQQYEHYRDKLLTFDEAVA